MSRARKKVSRRRVTARAKARGRRDISFSVSAKVDAALRQLAAEGRKVVVLGTVKQGRLQVDPRGLRTLRRLLPSSSIGFIALNALRVKVALLPAGHDPDTFLRAEGAEAFDERIRQARSLLAYALDRVITDPDGGSGPRARANAFARAALMLAKVPDATGPAVQIYESTRVILGAFQQATIYALIGIVIVLLVCFRNVRDAACALVPVAAATVLLLAIMRLADVPLNFANTIVLPLMANAHRIGSVAPL